jgi:hypothetical protein
MPELLPKWEPPVVEMPVYLPERLPMTLTVKIDGLPSNIHSSALQSLGLSMGATEIYRGNDSVFARFNRPRKAMLAAAKFKRNSQHGPTVKCTYMDLALDSSVSQKFVDVLRSKSISANQILQALLPLKPFKNLELDAVAGKLLAEQGFSEGYLPVVDNPADLPKDNTIKIEGLSAHFANDFANS